MPAIQRMSRENWVSLVSGVMIACLVISFMLALVWQGGDVLTNIGELAVIIAGFGAILGYQLVASMKRSFGSFVWSMGFSATILSAFLVIAVLQDQTVGLLLIVILGTSIGGFATLVLSGEIQRIKTLEKFLNKWFRLIGAGLLVLHISAAYLYPSAGYVVYQLTSGVSNPNLVATWFALLLLVIAVVFGVRYFGESKVAEPAD